MSNRKTCRYCDVECDRDGVCPECGSQWTQKRGPLLPLIGERPLEKALRPDCRGCGVKLTPNIVSEFANEEGRHHEMIGRRFTGTYGYASLFHTKQCALRFALKAARAGVRFGY